MPRMPWFRSPWFHKSLAASISEIAAPPIVIAASLLVVSAMTSETLASAARYWLIGAIFASAIPTAFVAIGTHSGRYTDRHVSARDQRTVPILVGLSSCLVGWLILASTGANGRLLGLYGAGFVLLAAIGAITLWWKVSAHAAVMTGAVVAVGIIGGPIWLIPGALLTAATGWSRVTLKQHTPAQVAVGIGLGAVITVAVFSLLTT